VSLLELDRLVLVEVGRGRRRAGGRRPQRARLLLGTDLVVVLPVFVLAEGAAVAGHAAPGAGLVGLASAVPARLQTFRSARIQRRGVTYVLLGGLRLRRRRRQAVVGAFLALLPVLPRL
jgi:hypothetical protein